WNGQNGVYYNGQLHIWNWNGSILTLEHGEEWHTGNNTHVYSVFAGDVDNDGKVEIVTGGDAFDNQSQYIAEFRVWDWNGSTLTLETSQGWRTGNYAAIQSVYADDVDNDSVPEIVTCGNDGSDAQLRIWNWNGTSLTLEHSEEWALAWLARALSVITADIDIDGVVEIVTGGEANELYDTQWVSSSQLCVWNWNGSSLALEDSVEWPLNGNSSYVWSVFSADVDDDGVVEVLTGGSGANGTHWVGKLDVWNFNGSKLVLETNREWITGGFAEVSSVYATDVNNDGVIEILTGGDAGLEDSIGGQLRVWAFDTGPPEIVEVSQSPESNVLPEDIVEVNATVVDHVSGVKEVSLNYTNGNGTWIIVNMTNLEGDVWNGTIPAFDYCTYVNYTIIAEDMVGYIITSPEKFGYQHQYHVVPEFPSLIILPLFMIVTLLTTIICKRKQM
ncbi:MAG: VCBS repeat-containing protein, partial [Candidatus Bathyarchaeota archaeon]